MTVFVTFGGLSWQKGSAAQLVSLVYLLRELDANVRVVLESHAFDLDAQPARELGIEMAGYAGTGAQSPHSGSLRLLGVHVGMMVWSLMRRLGYKGRMLASSRVAAALLSADLVIDLSGDSFRDRPGGFALAHVCFLLSAVTCGKPVAILSQSLGPFKWYSRLATRYCLNRITRISIREQRTASLLADLGVRSNHVSIAPDLAFCLPRASNEALSRLLPSGALQALEDRRRPVIGISVSCLVEALDTPGGRAYLDNMLCTITFLQRQYNAVVLLVPHVVTPESWGKDDVDVARELLARRGANECLFAITEDPTPSEVKAILSICDLFLAARMHAAIAALSSAVPTIMLSWSHKYDGLMRHIGLEQFVWHVEEPVSRLEELIDLAWRNRASLTETLSAYTAVAQEAVRRELTDILRLSRRGESTESRHTSVALRSDLSSTR